MGDRLETIDIGHKLGAVTLLGGRAGCPCNTMRPRPTLVPSGILFHPAVWPQQTWTDNWGLCPFFGEGQLGPHLSQCGLSRGLPPYRWHLDPSRRFGTVHMGRKIGRSIPIWEGGIGTPSNTMSLGSRPNFLPSGIFEPFDHNRYGENCGGSDPW